MPTEAKPPAVPRIRTYRDDLARAKEKGETKAAAAPSTPAAATSVPPPVTKPEAVPVPPQPKPVPPPPQQPSPSKVPPAAPAFHKEASAIARDLSKIEVRKRSSITTDDDHAFDVHADTELGDGMIVTDQKRDRFQLVPAVKTAVTEWLFDKKDAYEEGKKPKFTVAPATERKEVIERAAEGGVLAPKNDYKEVSARLRHVPRVKVSVKPTVRDASEVPKPSWHKVGEPVPEKKPVPTPVPVPAPAPVEAAPPPVPQPEPEPPPPPVESVRPLPVPEPVPTPAPKPEPQPIPEQPLAPRTTAAPRRNYARLGTFALIGVAIVAVLAGVGVTVWLFTGSDNTPPVERQTENQTNPIVAADTTAEVQLGSRNAFLENLTAAANSASAARVTYIAPVTAGGAPAIPAEIIGVLNPTAPGTFLRSVDTIGFGSYGGSAPCMVLSVPSFDVALGGMLEWEDAIMVDLAPFFGTPGSATGFVDVVIGNRDMRVLYDEDGAERLVYSFPNRTTILITTTSDAAAYLLPLVR